MDKDQKVLKLMEHFSKIYREDLYIRCLKLLRNKALMDSI